MGSDAYAQGSKVRKGYLTDADRQSVCVTIPIHPSFLEKNKDKKIGIESQKTGIENGYTGIEMKL